MQNVVKIEQLRPLLSNLSTAVDSNLIYKPVHNTNIAVAHNDSVSQHNDSNIPQMIQKSHTKSKKKNRSSSEKKRSELSDSKRKNSLKMTPNNEKRQLNFNSG